MRLEEGLRRKISLVGCIVWGKRGMYRVVFYLGWKIFDIFRVFWLYYFFFIIWFLCIILGRFYDVRY